MEELSKQYQIMKNTTLIINVCLIILFPFVVNGQSEDERHINANFKNTLLLHKEFVSIPNLPQNKELMLDNINWVANQYKMLD